MSRPKVLLILHELSQTGAPKIALDVFAGAKGAYDLRVVAATGGKLTGRAAELGPTLVVQAGDRPAGRAVGWLARAVARRVAIWRLRRWRPDLVYVNSCVPVWMVPMLVTDPTRVPIVVHVHELDSHLDFTAEYHAEWLLRRPTRYIAVSGAVQKALIARGVPAERIALVHAFIPAVVLDRPLPPASGATGPFVVGGSGNVYWRKGVTLWLQTAAAVRRLRPDLAVKFVWVGQTHGRGVDIRARHLGLSDVVELVGEVADPFAHYARFDVLLMSSWEDPCPLVVFEAMALGKPVVCFAGGGGAPEQVGDTGVVVPDGFSPDAAAAALIALADDPGRRAALGAAARVRVRERFTDRVQVPKVKAEVEAALRVAGVR